MSDNGFEKLLNGREVADLLGVKPSTIAWLSCKSAPANRRLPVIKIGRLSRYSLKEIQKWLAAQNANITSPAQNSAAATSSAQDPVFDEWGERVGETR